MDLNKLLGFSATKIKHFQRYNIPHIFKNRNFQVSIRDLE